MPARLYSRFSPRPNAKECDSCDKQLADLRRWCQERGIPVASEYRDEGVSGAERNRTGLWTCVNECQKGDMILVRDWDRFARDRTFAGILIGDLRKKGVQVRSISETGDMPESSESRLVSNIMLDIAEYRREIIGARTRAAMLRQQKEGKVVGGIPKFGWKREDGKLVEAPEEQEVLVRIKQMLADNQTFYRIAKTLNEEGAYCRGKSWHHWRINCIARRA